MQILGYSKKYKGVEYIPYKEPKSQIYKHTIYSHSRKGIISPTGNVPRTRISSVYNKFFLITKLKMLKIIYQELTNNV